MPPNTEKAHLGCREAKKVEKHWSKPLRLSLHYYQTVEPGFKIAAQIPDNDDYFFESNDDAKWKTWRLPIDAIAGSGNEENLESILFVILIVP